MLQKKISTVHGFNAMINKRGTKGLKDSLETALVKAGIEDFREVKKETVSI